MLSHNRMDALDKPMLERYTRKGIEVLSLKRKRLRMCTRNRSHNMVSPLYVLDQWSSLDGEPSNDCGYVINRKLLEKATIRPVNMAQSRDCNKAARPMIYFVGGFGQKKTIWHPYFVYCSRNRMSNVLVKKYREVKIQPTNTHCSAYFEVVSEQEDMILRCINEMVLESPNFCRKQFILSRR